MYSFSFVLQIHFVNFCFKKYLYLCNQEVEEETGSAGEQPVSNKLPDVTQ